jgi:hypothetical protein
LLCLAIPAHRPTRPFVLLGFSNFAVVQPDGLLYRLARPPDPWAWSDWSYAGPDGTFGNRWDDPLGSYRILYASTRRAGAFVEMLARFRPDLSVLAGLAAIEGDEDVPPPPGVVPLRWLDGRRIGETSITGDFVDIGDISSLATLRAHLAAGQADAQPSSSGTR